MIVYHTLAPGDELEVWIPRLEQYIEVRISPDGVPEIFCTPNAAVFRRSAAVFERRANTVGRISTDPRKDAGLS
jgi:hypothetical protein